ncbi:MAG: hypothetical protein AB1403_00595 [Candidatus Riflebacteria bacterium]
MSTERAVKAVDVMRVEEVRDLIVLSATPSEAVEAIEGLLAESANDPEVIHALVWLMVIDHYRLNFKRGDKN